MGAGPVDALDVPIQTSSTGSCERGGDSTSCEIQSAAINATMESTEFPGGKAPSVLQIAGTIEFIHLGKQLTESQKEQLHAKVCQTFADADLNCASTGPDLRKFILKAAAEMA